MADPLSELLELARGGHFDRTQALPPAANDPGPDPEDARLTRHWRIEYRHRADIAPFRVTFIEPQTRRGLLEQFGRKQPGQPIPDLRPLPPDFEAETLQQLDLSLSDTARNAPTPDTAEALPDTELVSVDTGSTDTGPAPARVLLEREGVTVSFINTPEQAARVVADLLARPETGGPWGLDIETMALPEYRRDSKAGLDPYRSAIRLVQVFPGGAECFVFDVGTLGLSCLEPLWGRAMVAHNATFELKHLLHGGATPQRLGCSMLMANALRGDRPSLADLAADVLGWDMDKALQVSDWGGDLSPEQLDYAALDAVAAFQLAAVMVPELGTEGRGRCYATMRDAQTAIARLELAGCPFDAEGHKALMTGWQTAAEAARGELDTLMGGVNPDSPAQLAAWLTSNLPTEALVSWPRTKTGALSTDADTLAGLTLPALEPLARYKGARKLLSTYGTSYAGHLHPVTGRIHASFLLGATATGRLACRTPNIQNPPRGADFRALFAPTGGRVFVVADYSQIELRVAALVSGDDAMLKAYADGEDLHRKTAAAILGVELSAVTKEQRQMAKACIAAGSLVLTARGLVPIEHVTPQDLVWDGLAWVSHDGVVYQGYREVMTYDGLTATPDHRVFLANGDTRLLADAANSGGIGLAWGEFEGFPVRFVGSHQHDCDREGDSHSYPDPAAFVRPVPVSDDADDEAGFPGKSATPTIDRGAWGNIGEVSESVPEPRGTGAGSGAGGTVRCHLSAVQQPPSRMVPGLWGAGHSSTVRESRSLYPLGAGEPSTRDLSRGSDRPDGQQRALRTGEFAACFPTNEPTQYPAEPLLHLSRRACGGFGPLASTEDRLSRLRPIPNTNGETGGARGSCRGHSGAEAETQYAHVYDILNAGPRHRFAVSGRVVHNCNFGLLFGQGVKGLQRYAKASYGVDMSETEAKRARSAFFAAYPGLSKWQTRTREAAERAGQVRTPGGRVRNLEGTRSLATESLNTPIQGGAAECLLAAMANLEPRLVELGAALVNVVHDELVVECDPERAADVAAAIEDAMTRGFLSVFPEGSTRELVDAHSGPNWAAAKG